MHDEAPFRLGVAVRGPDDVLPPPDGDDWCRRWSPSERAARNVLYCIDAMN